MTVLNNSTPAERERGLSWSSDLLSASAIVKDGGAITGTPTFDRGVVLDGTNDYVTYNNVVGQFNSASVSILIRFTPDFAYDEDVVRYIYDSRDF